MRADRPARRTRIIVTLGPATDAAGILERLFRAGADVARVNSSHGTHDDHRRRIRAIRAVERKLNRAIPVIYDLSGPKLRTGVLPGGPRRLNAGERVTLAPETGLREGEIPVSHSRLADDVKRGDRILVDDGSFEWVVIRVVPPRVVCRVRVGGILKDHKGLNFPGVRLSLPPLTAKDGVDISFAVSQRVDYLAQSFVRSARDVALVRRRLAKLRADIPIIAKIEKPEAVDDLDAIVAISEAVMVARGDLGVELPPERVPEIQKRIIRAANAGETPVVTATQMLESMIEHPRPTRAEASDVANAIFDGSDAVMLSGETASGAYPVESVVLMAEIALQAEQSEFWVPPAPTPGDRSVAHAVAFAAARAAEDVGARAIVCFTETGRTALLLSRCVRGRPIIAIARRFEICRRMGLYPGVVSRTLAMPSGTDVMIAHALASLRKERMFSKGDRVVVVSGSARGRGATNLLKVETV